MLTTTVVDRRPIAFWRGCRPQLASLLKAYDTLVNAIDARHRKALGWGRRLGFRLEAAAPFGVAGLPFHRFRVRKEDLCAARQSRS
jgi:hypothetical protein